MTAGVVLVTSRSFGSGEADPQGLLAEHGLKVVRGDPEHRPGELADALSDAVAWIAGVGPVTAAHLARAPRLRLIARYGVGVDAVDLGACAQRGVLVTNTPEANTDAVAEHTVALVLAALRRVTEGDRAVRNGAWPSLQGRELGRLGVGIVGFGRIGRRVGALVRCLGAAVYAHDPYVADAVVQAGGATPLALDDLVACADVVTLHRPESDKPVVDEALLERMRPGAVLVNTARAGLVDEAAVAAALERGRLGVFASDVTRLGAGTPLAGAPRTVLSPHVGAQTTEAIDRMGMTAAEEVLRVVARNQPPRHPVPRP